jgi:hypothetical protein
MLKQVHEHIVSELQQNARTDTLFVVTAIAFNLIVQIRLTTSYWRFLSL